MGHRGNLRSLPDGVGTAALWLARGVLCRRASRVVRVLDSPTRSGIANLEERTDNDIGFAAAAVAQRYSAQRRDCHAHERGCDVRLLGLLHLDPGILVIAGGARGPGSGSVANHMVARLDGRGEMAWLRVVRVSSRLGWPSAHVCVLLGGRCCFGSPVWT